MWVQSLKGTLNFYFSKLYASHLTNRSKISQVEITNTIDEVVFLKRHLVVVLASYNAFSSRPLLFYLVSQESQTGLTKAAARGTPLGA